MTTDPPPADDEAMAGLGEAFGHLQAAALSMVAAARTALDAAEKLARDPSPLLTAAFEAAQAATRVTGQDAAPEQDPAEPSGAVPRRPRVEHIVVDPPPDDARP
ncbi:MAG: hypothetical protein ABIS47_06975 [Acidimicrobiales bacterium]